MDKTPKVSFVIPVSDINEMDAAFTDCLLSLQYEDYEALIVLPLDEDGERLRSKLPEGDERFRIVYSKKKSYAALKNTGIKASAGKYLLFPDTGDRLWSSFPGTLIKSISKGRAPEKGFERLPVQLGICGYELFNEEGVFFETPESGIRVMDREDMLCRIFYIGNDEGCIYNKIFRSDIIKRCGIRFDEGCGSRMDQLFLLRYLKHVDAVRMDPVRVYSRREEIREGRINPGNIRALLKMLPLLFGHPDAAWLCRQNLYYEMRKK